MQYLLHQHWDCLANIYFQTNVNLKGKFTWGKVFRVFKQIFFKGCLPQILLGLFLNTLTHLYSIYFSWFDFIKSRNRKIKEVLLIRWQIKNKIYYESIFYGALFASRVIAIVFLWQWYISRIFILNLAFFKVRTQTIIYKTSVGTFLLRSIFAEKSLLRKIFRYIGERLFVEKMHQKKANAET